MEHPERVDSEYERAGTVAGFLFCEPPLGWREAQERERCTTTDWALTALREGRLRGCKKVTLALDNLNPHTMRAVELAVEPARAEDLVLRIEFCGAPQHGSWLNTAENEPSTDDVSMPDWTVGRGLGCVSGLNGRRGDRRQRAPARSCIADEDR